eukprot:gene5623-4104_t
MSKGNIINEGGYNVIFEIELLKNDVQSEGDVFVVDTFNVHTGELLSVRYNSLKTLTHAYPSKEVVIRKLKNIINRRAPDNLDADCLTSILTKLWNETTPSKKTKYTQSSVHSFIKSMPEWNMLWKIFKLGVIARHKPVDAFTSMHVKDTYIVTLCIRTRKGIYPVLRRFTGDLGSKEFTKKLTLGRILDVAEAVLETLSYFSLYGFFHHGDVKSNNILWKDMPDGSIIVRLADYDTMVQIPDHVALNSLDMSVVTDLYASPFSVSAQTFDSSFAYFQSKSILIPQDITARTIRKSWEPLKATHAHKRQEGNKNWRCDLLNMLVSKSDLYSLGLVIAAFGLSSTITSKKVINKLSGFVRNLVTIEQMPIGSFDPHKETPVLHASNNTDCIMTISDATIQLSQSEQASRQKKSMHQFTPNLIHRNAHFNRGLRPQFEN